MKSLQAKHEKKLIASGRASQCLTPPHVCLLLLFQPFRIYYFCEASFAYLRHLKQFLPNDSYLKRFLFYIICQDS